MRITPQRAVLYIIINGAVLVRTLPWFLRNCDDALARMSRQHEDAHQLYRTHTSLRIASWANDGGQSGYPPRITLAGSSSIIRVTLLFTPCQVPLSLLSHRYELPDFGSFSGSCVRTYTVPSGRMSTSQPNDRPCEPALGYSRPPPCDSEDTEREKGGPVTTEIIIRMLEPSWHRDCLFTACAEERLALRTA